MLLETAFICLALNTYHEAKNQSLVGQIATAQVVMNRVEDKRFPNTICEVVKQGPTRPSWEDPKKEYPIRHRCQFSWYCDGKSDMVRDFTSYEEIIELAIDVMVSRYEDNTNGSLFYHADYVEPAWAQHMAMTTKIDSHIFYTVYND